MIDITKLAASLKTNPILKLAENINNSEAEFNRLVLEIQASCPHTEKKKNLENNDDPFSKRKVLSTECIACGLIQNKPKGWDYQICIKCWTPMKDDGTRLVGEDRTHFYKCPNCGNSASHT
jgi:hypothetical protein